jgi:hypothetical protein
MSIQLGKMICIADPQQAAERDRIFKEGRAEPPPPFPQLTQGLLLRDESGRLEGPAGALSPQPFVMRDGVRARFDAFVRPGFVVIANGFEPHDLLDAAQLDFLERLGTRFARIGTGDGAFTDVDGTFAAFFAGAGAAVVIRPDYYIYGGTPEPAGLPALVDRLRADFEPYLARVKITAGQPA